MSENKKGFVINSPYDEPSLHHVYDEVHSTFNPEPGRRKAGYFIAPPGSKEYTDKSVFVELELVNKIRACVKTWRENNYPGITNTTRRLLEHWHDKSARPDNPFFFCQIEAIETLIFLAETRAEFNIPNDGGMFKRICTKLCTGGGKTIVMAMLIAWQVCNKINYRRDTRFTRNVLVIAPNLTVKKRLQVLQPGNPENYYDRFDIVPVEMRDVINQARITIHNWQVLSYETEEEIAKKKSVDKRGPKSDNAYVREIFGDLTRANHVIVINDEAHHAWRVKPNPKRKKLTEDEKEATVWIRGLDRINRASKILTCYDFSATPFVPGMGINDEEGLFGWIVSDYSLSDGIEAGIVKTPRVVVADNSTPDTKTYRSKFFHIYADDEVKRSFTRNRVPEEEELPGLVKMAYMFLGHDWKKTFDAWNEANAPTPPVMITVANRTETAARIAYTFRHGNIDVPELCNEENILHIDSDVLKKSKDEDALREEVDTVGKEGQPGANKYNIISVGMLSEGWDARTVTHIMGLRAFTSQLLCEQVVGRGLRRSSYDVPDSEDGLFEPEYVNVFGVPFNLLLFGADDGKLGAPENPRPEGTKHIIKTLDERSQFIISWPNITRLEYVMRQDLSIDIGKIPELVLNAEKTAIIADLAPVIDGKTDMMKCNEVDLEKIYSSMRLQNIIFKTAGEVYDKTLTEWQKRGVKLALLGQVIKLVENYLETGNIKIYPELFAINEARKKIMLAMNMERIIMHIWGYITSEQTEKILPVIPQGKRMRSTEEMPSWYTARPIHTIEKSHINYCVLDSSWEKSEAYCLDKNPNVKAWAKNDHLGFHVSYIYEGVLRRYLPDFLIKLANDKMLILEVKGLETEQDKLKRERLSDWVKAVNGVKIFGEWACDVSRSPADVDGIIAKYL